MLEWLPVQALANDQILAAIGAAVAKWTRLWFGSAKFTLVDVETSRNYHPLDVDDKTARRYGGGLWLINCEYYAQNLALLALDAVAKNLALTAGDRQLLTAFGERIVDGLANMIAAELELEQEQYPDQAWTAVHGSLRIGLASANLDASMILVIEGAALVAFRKRLIAPYRPMSNVLSDRQSAVVRTPCTCSARFGFARLGKSDFVGLEAGDVIMLDQRIDEPVDLTLSTTGQLVAKASSRFDEDRLIMTMCQL